MITMRQLYDMGKPGKSIVDYLLDSVADGPGNQPNAEYGASRYYTEPGTPPGRWTGSGLKGLSENLPEDVPEGDRGIRPGGIVDPRHLKALIADGANPITQETLGRSFPSHMGAAQRADILLDELPDSLSPEERDARVRQIKRATARAASARAVHAFDHTFAPPKSVSVLWALGDQGVREQVEAAHHDAINHIVTTMEADTIRTRTGSGGVVQERTRGMLAASFDHWDSRAGDPHLHTHLVIANRVQGEDGRWRTLDSRGMLFPSLVSLSEAYDNYLMDGLASRLGVSFSPRTLSRTGREQWHVDGISDRLIEEFSQRHAQIDQARDDASGHWDADARAWAATRADKQHRPLSELTAQWRRRAERLAGPDPLAGVTGRPVTPPGTIAGQDGKRTPPVRSADITDERIEQMAQRVVQVLQAGRPHWSDWNIRAESERVLRRVRAETPAEHDQLRRRLCRAATGRCVRVDRVDRAHTPARWRRPDGTSRFAPEHDAIWVTQDLLDAEAYLIRVSETTGMPAVQGARTIVSSWRSADGRRLGDDQVDAVASILSSGRGIDIMIGPAGSGKTTALSALTDTWRAHHGRVVGLAPSAAAAQVLSDSLGIPTANTAQWLVGAEHGHAPLHEGDLLIIDEASMAATLPLAQIVSRAQAAGTRVLCVGDPEQLGAVEAGGGFGMLTRRRADPPTLSRVRRFHQPWQAQASLMLRQGDASALSLYEQSGCVTQAPRQDAIEEVYTAWAADRAAGADSLMIAADNATVAALNARARDDLAAAGAVTGREVALHDGTRASAGDRVVTRLNARALATGRHHVHNGAAWDVVAAGADGSLLVTPAGDPTAAAISLPAAYVARNVELAYASTAHRSQGRTVDRAHALVDSTMTRQTLYVALTRARGDNVAHVVVDDPHPDTDDIHWGESTRTKEKGGRLTGHPEALRVMAEVLRRDHADRTAREAAERASARAGTVKHLADEYTTIAAGQARDGWQIALPDLLPHAADALKADPRYDALCDLLSRKTARGVDVRAALPHLAGPDRPLSASHPASDLAARVGRLSPPQSRRLIAGLITPAPPSPDPDTQQALDERARRIETRASRVLAHAVRHDEPWTRSLGRIPDDPVRRAAWLRAATTVAAYRDRYLVTDGTAGDSPHMDPLGVSPAGTDRQTEADDHQRARRALETAREISAQPAARHSGRRDPDPTPTTRPRPRPGQDHDI